MTGFVRRLALACALLSTLAAAGTGIASAATLARTAFPIATFDESLASRFVTIGDVTYFEASSPTEGTSLWRSDGTPAGTQLVKGVHPNYSCCPSDDDPSLVSVGETLFFQGHEFATGYELWKSDGSTAGTQIVKDLVPGSESGGAGRLTRVGDKLFFLGTNAYLFTSDGTEAGTQLVPPGWFFFPFDLTEANGLLFFNWEWIPDQRFDLWRSDGTEAGTYRVGPRSDELTDVNGALFSTRYRSEGESVVHELWRTDGSAAAVIVKDIEPEVQLQNWFPGPSSLTNVNGTLLFVTSYSAYESAIWSSDGTS